MFRKWSFFWGMEKEATQPMLVSLGAHSLLVATLVAVSDGDGVDVWG